MLVDIRNQFLDYRGLAKILTIVGIAVVRLAPTTGEYQDHRRQRPLFDGGGKEMHGILIRAFGVVATMQPVDHRVPAGRSLIAGRKPDVVPDLLIHGSTVIAMMCDARLWVLGLVEPDHVMRKSGPVWIDRLGMQEQRRAKRR